MRYVHQDHPFTDDTGAAVYEASYDSWGNVRASTGTADTDRLYTGQRFDSATGLYYYNARYYDPTLARFISPDTIVPGVGDPQAWNRYAYVLGNPLRYTDPSGHCMWEYADDPGVFGDDGSGNDFDCSLDLFFTNENFTRSYQYSWLYMAFTRGLLGRDNIQAILWHLENRTQGDASYWYPLAAVGKFRPGWDNSNCSFSAGGGYVPVCQAHEPVAPTENTMTLPPGEQGITLANSAACGGALTSLGINVGVDLATVFTGGVGTVAGAAVKGGGFIISTLGDVVGIATSADKHAGANQSGSFWLGVGSLFTSPARIIRSSPFVGSVVSWSSLNGACSYN